MNRNNPSVGVHYIMYQIWYPGYYFKRETKYHKYYRPLIHLWHCALPLHCSGYRCLLAPPFPNPLPPLPRSVIVLDNIVYIFTYGVAVVIVIQFYKYYRPLIHLWRYALPLHCCGYRCLLDPPFTNPLPSLPQPVIVLHNIVPIFTYGAALRIGVAVVIEEDAYEEAVAGFFLRYFVGVGPVLHQQGGLIHLLYRWLSRMLNDKNK